ncbi:bis(5'-nucleosyl)-tetraphosphatase (symmetrical) YqeK [Deinococcus sp. Leaf326]|uniref:bis(5'-nucleosyl)-tetraphosphatase (symmetrical) YqeK n=1 Tax=Deinococcus sp. Leaf326 TaxID=1736338 RepID=UPI0006F32A2A|nr:bis(5'-nucleosyl)-tetraphosphatase (symmetrical) YqeK [Deinococcus sp. Leaf326]KQQ97738.1 metal-dependent phosphohydrolase [Deinococcus sp. Leaf326]
MNVALRLPAAWPALGAWEARVRLMVRPRRFEHVQRVATLARQIAVANHLSAQQIEQAYAAGILHDIARDLPDAELLRLAPPECDIDALHPLALHGRAARTLLEHWGYRDAVVLEAVEDHTTGPRGGNPVAACVYIADVSEPGRGVNDDIRELALHDLGAALNRAIVSKVTYLQGRGITVHPRTMTAYQALEPGSSAAPTSVENAQTASGTTIRFPAPSRF